MTFEWSWYNHIPAFRTRCASSWTTLGSWRRVGKWCLEEWSYTVKCSKTSKNGTLCERIPHNFYHMHFIDLKLVASASVFFFFFFFFFFSKFFLSDKYPLDMFYYNLHGKRRTCQIYTSIWFHMLKHMKNIDWNENELRSFVVKLLWPGSTTYFLTFVMWQMMNLCIG